MTDRVNVCHQVLGETPDILNRKFKSLDGDCHVYQVNVDNQVMLLLCVAIQPLHLLHPDRGDRRPCMSNSGDIPRFLLVVLKWLSMRLIIKSIPQ